MDFIKFQDYNDFALKIVQFAKENIEGLSDETFIMPKILISNELTEEVTGDYSFDDILKKKGKVERQNLDLHQTETLDEANQGVLDQVDQLYHVAADIIEHLTNSERGLPYFDMMRDVELRASDITRALMEIDKREQNKSVLSYWNELQSLISMVQERTRLTTVLSKFEHERFTSELKSAEQYTAITLYQDAIFAYADAYGLERETLFATLFAGEVFKALHFYNMPLKRKFLIFGKKKKKFEDTRRTGNAVSVVKESLAMVFRYMVCGYIGSLIGNDEAALALQDHLKACWDEQDFPNWPESGAKIIFSADSSGSGEIAENRFADVLKRSFESWDDAYGALAEYYMK